MVFQHFSLVPSFSVYENVVLGSEPRSGIRFDREKAIAEVRALTEKFRLNVDPLPPVRTLPVGQQQRVEILKALYRNARILILDEPTAVLAPQEVAELFVAIRSLVEQGRTVIFIAHKLPEVLEISDTITVMRQGKTVGRVKTSEVTEHEPRHDDGRPRDRRCGSIARDTGEGPSLPRSRGCASSTPAATTVVAGPRSQGACRRNRRAGGGRGQRAGRSARGDRRPARGSPAAIRSPTRTCRSERAAAPRGSASPRFPRTASPKGWRPAPAWPRTWLRPSLTDKRYVRRGLLDLKAIRPMRSS